MGGGGQRSFGQCPKFGSFFFLMAPLIGYSRNLSLFFLNIHIFRNVDIDIQETLGNQEILENKSKNLLFIDPLTVKFIEMCRAHFSYISNY